MWVKFKNWLIKISVMGLIKAGKADTAKTLCLSMITEIDKSVKDKELGL